MSIKEPLLQIRKFTSAYRSKLLADRVFAGCAVSLSVYLTVSAILGILFSIFPWTALPVVWIFAAALLILSFVIISTVLFISRPNLIKTAKLVESRCDIKHPTLSLSLELSQSDNDDTDNASKSLKKLTFERAAGELSTISKTRFLPDRKRVFIITTILLIFNAALITFSSNKLIHYWKLPFVLIAGEKALVEPGSITVPMNASVNLRLTGAGSNYPSARLETWPLNSQNRNRHFLKADSAGGFSLSLENIKESFVYQFSLSSSMPPETVTVVPPPALRSLQITLTPPRYTKLPVRKLPLGQGNITAYAGTTVSVALESNDLKKAGVVIDNDTVFLDVNKKSASGSFTVTKSAGYTFTLTDTLGQSSDTLPHFIISRVEDEPPIARILRPGANKVLTVAQAETLWVEGIDDFGISRLALQYRRSGETEHESWDISEKGSPPVIRKQLAWSIRELSLYPGDTLYYWLWARDNKPFGRPQVAYSDTFWFRVPSFEEIHKEIAQKEQYAKEKIGEVRNRQNKISSDVEKLVRSAVGSKELSWDQQRVLNDVKEQMKAQADSLQKAFDALNESMEQLKEDGKIDEELLAKMEQIQKSVEELMKEFGKELFAMDKNQKMTMNDMRQAASKLQQMLPQLSEQLDQTLAFLEMLRQDKQLADLALRAENLASEQSDLAGLEDGAMNDRRQQDLLDRIDNLNKDVGDFFKQQDSDTPSSSEAVQELSQQMREQNSGSSSNDGKNCKAKKNAMSRELLSLSEQLKSNMRMNMMAKMEEDRRLILSMAHDVLSLEEWQSLIRANASGSEDDRGVAFSMQALGNALRASFAKIDSLSMAGPQLLGEITRVYRNALSKVGTTVSSLAKTDGTAQMEQSLFALRETAHLLLSILDDGDDDGDESGGGGGCMMSGLRRASGRQAALNSMMGQMLQQMLGMGQQKPGGSQEGASCPLGGNREGGSSPGGEGGEAQAEARRQAQEAQKAIADELKRLAESYGKDAGKTMEERVKELEQEARRIAALLENPPDDIIDLQDRFLSRMLQATLSLNRKDEGKEERKGNRSEILFSESSAGANAGAASSADSFHLLRKRAFEDNFPEEYRSAIRDYFNSLGEMKWGE
ncbi:MAG: hypothetical protein FWE57_09685 [Chitinispirillia bacterium]|nr:hypothetical protein [Chitinispirillia bacterium]